MRRTTTRDEYERRILRVQRRIEEGLGEPVPPAELARVAGMALHHFHRVFRGVTGESVMQYTRRLHLERAARQLYTGGRPVLEVALDAGYASHEAFTRAFVDTFGVPPSRFRDAGVPQARRPCAPVAPPARVEVRDEPALPVLSARAVGTYSEVGAAWDRLFAWYLTLPNAAPTDAVPMYGLVPDDPQVTEEARLRYDACVPVPPGLDPARLADGPVTARTIPAGRYAVVLHHGPYETLAESYLALIGAWFPSSGYALAAEPVVERYLNSPQSTAPADLRTEIRVRIEARGWMS